MTTRKILFNIPLGTSLCTARFRVEVEAGSDFYENEYFDITVKPR